MKRAILNIADTGALESTAHMLREVGYECSRPDDGLLNTLRTGRLSGVLSVDDLVKDWGYDYPLVTERASGRDVRNCDLFVDVKAHENYPGLVSLFPNLEGKVLWCCLNGGNPLLRTDGLPWASPPCPVLTNNQWYGVEACADLYSPGSFDAGVKVPWYGKAYTCFPHYVRYAEHTRTGHTGPPICTTHNVERWGYGEWVHSLREQGVRFLGGNCPDGLVPHGEIITLLENARCLVHLKKGDTVSYATLEAMASGCPIIFTKFYVEECRLQALAAESLVVESLDGLIDTLDALKDPTLNAQIGCAQRVLLHQLMWGPKDVPGFAAFMERHYGGKP